jgi:hypothetical protein
MRGYSRQMLESGTDLQIRPSVRALMRWMFERVRSGKQYFLAMLGLISAAALGSLAFSHGRNAIVLLVVVGGAAILAAGFLVAGILYFITTRLCLLEDRLELATFGSRKEWPRALLARVARCAIRSPMGFTPDRLLVILNGHGRAVLWLRLAYWDEASLEPLWEALHVTVEGSWGELASYDDAAERFPAA